LKKTLEEKETNANLKKGKIRRRGGRSVVQTTVRKSKKSRRSEKRGGKAEKQENITEPKKRTGVAWSLDDVETKNKIVKVSKKRKKAQDA